MYNYILGDKRFELLKVYYYWVYSSTLLTDKGTLLFMVSYQNLIWWGILKSKEYK